MFDEIGDIKWEEEQLKLSGNVCFSNVMPIYQKSLPYLRRANPIIIDCALLKACDSAGFALMIEWIKYAKKNQKKLRLQALPEDLLALAKAARLEAMLTSLIPIEETNGQNHNAHTE